MSQIKNDTQVLHCPECGGNNLHHEVVRVFDRANDAPSGLTVTVSEGAVRVTDNLDSNPSRRRGGMTITFTCENCGGRTEDLKLDIYQHKGCTLVAWQPILVPAKIDLR